MKKCTRSDKPSYEGTKLDCQCFSGRATWGDRVVYEHRYSDSRLMQNGEIEEFVGSGGWVREDNPREAIRLLIMYVESLHEKLVSAGVLDKPDLIYSLPGNGHHPKCVYYAEDSFIDEGD